MSLHHKRRMFVVLVSGFVFQSLSGCVVINKYSVFGFDRLQADSPEQARSWALLVIVALLLLAFGAGGALVWYWKSAHASKPKLPEQSSADLNGERAEKN